MKRVEEKIQKSYHFFKRMTREKRDFTIDEITNATGWSKATVKTYLSKKWDAIVEKGQEGFRVKELKYSEAEYAKLMSQVNKISQDPYKPDFNEEIEQLVTKARESALLALDIYNRPATMFKSEGFVVMMIIAWTSLFHAIFSKRGEKFNYKEDDGTDKYIDGDLKYWELSTCLKKYYQETHSAVKVNIEFMIGLRNKIEHRFAPKIDGHIGGECQALLLNFDELLTQEFGSYYSLRDLLVFPLQTSNLKHSGRSEVMKKFQGRHYDEIKDYIDAFRHKISDDVFNDPQFSFQVYLIPKTANRKNSSDLAIEFVKYDPNNPHELEAQKHLIALIKEKIVKTGNPEGLKPSIVALKVSEAIKRPFTTNHHTKAWKYYDARPTKFVKNFFNDWCYSDNVHEDYVFTPSWVEHLKRRLSEDEEYQKVISFNPNAGKK